MYRIVPDCKEHTMSGNTVEVQNEGPDTSLTFIHYGMQFDSEQEAMIAKILRQTEQQILRQLQQMPQYPANAVTEDRLTGYRY